MSGIVIEAGVRAHIRQLQPPSIEVQHLRSGQLDKAVDDFAQVAGDFRAWRTLEKTTSALQREHRARGKHAWTAESAKLWAMAAGDPDRHSRYRHDRQ